MDIPSKLEYAKRAVEFIAEHTDAPAKERKSALNAIKAFCDEQSAKIDKEQK